MSARIERRLKWWKENRKKVENTEKVTTEKNDTKVRKTVEARKKKGSDVELSTNLDKGFKCKLLSPVSRKRKFSDSADEGESNSKNTSPGFVFEASESGPSRSEDESKDTELSKSDLNRDDATKSEKKKSSRRKVTKAEKSPTAIRTDVNEEIDGGGAEQIEKKGKKYVLFIGNLPYRAQKHHIEKHFSKCNVMSVRLRTDKDTNRSRGFAYIELKDGKGFKQALLLHHSALLGRQINVEFTTIGGGKSKKRAEKLKEKNQRCERFKVMRPEDERYSKKEGQG